MLYLTNMTRKKYRNKRQRFLEVAEARTNAVLERIRILGNCSNKQLYEYSEEEISNVFKVLEDELHQVKQRFLINKKQKGRKFRL